MAKFAPLAERIWEHISPEPNSGCWVWTGARNHKDYGSVRMPRHGPMKLAYRVVYELFRGPIPEGLQLDHLCRVPACVNPAHLEPVTQSVNLLRGHWPPTRTNANRDKTHCPRGHPFSGENILIYPSRPKARNCRRCQRERGVRRRLGRSNV